MRDVSTYKDVRNNERIGFVQEKPQQHAEIFYAQIDKYIDHLKSYEWKCVQPGANPETLLREISDLNDSMLQACAQFEENTSDPISIKAAQSYFRKKTQPVLSNSYGINRIRTWPQGHQGDYMTLELIYRNMPMSAGLGYYLDKYMLDSDLGLGVRDRIVKLRDLLKEELIGRRNPKVLDIACGSCREVFELAPEIKSSGAKFTCVDLDSAALNFAVDRLTYAGLSSDQTELLTYNALRIFDFETAHAEFGMRDIIYSVGFFDYLPDEFLVKLLKSMYMLLNPGGKIIAAFKDVEYYRPQIYHWFADWDGFLQRTVVDFNRLFHDANIPDSELSMSRVKSGSIVFYTASKQ
jgi:SAM-dependent methyltransferase